MMEMDPQEREDEMGDDSPISHNDEEISDPDGESGRESGDDLRRQAVGNMVTDHHEDLIAKLKMQVRDIKDDFENASRHLNFTLPRGAVPENFHLPSPFSFPHPGAPLMQPMLQPTKPSSGSSNSSDGSNTWSFEEQFKQLYDISDDPKRKEFLDELFSFMHKRGTPINRLPIMAKSVLDLYQLYNLVVQRGGLVEVINKKLWQEIIKGLQLPSSITSAAFTLRTQYMKYLYPFEVEQHHLSTEADLQAAIDGNRREGRRSNYAQYDTVQRSPNLTQQIPLSLMSQQQQLARMNSVMSGGLALHNGTHHSAHPHQPLSQPVNGGALAAFAHSDMEARMLEYVKMFKDLRVPNATSPRQENMSPPIAAPSPFNQLELSRTLWNVYNNNQPQKEALNLADSNTQSSIKREPEHRESPPPSKKMFKAEEEPKPVVSPTTHIKISNRGDARNGESSLFVSMEINGVTYEGVLCALTPPSNGRSSLSP